MESDQQYFWRRYNEQTAAAERATTARARISHLELAARYAQLAAAIGTLDESVGSAESAQLNPRHPTGVGRGHNGQRIPA
jgi:hypothetical protein